MEHNITDLLHLKRAECKPLVNITPDFLVQSLGGTMGGSLGGIAGGQLAITVTFRDDWLGTFRVEYIQKELRKFMDKQAKKYGFRYIMAQDYSNTYRLHYHGILWYTNDYEHITKLRLSIQRKFGRTELRGVAYDKTYYSYVFGLYIAHHEKYNPNILWGNQRVIADTRTQYIIDNSEKIIF